MENVVAYGRSSHQQPIAHGDTLFCDITNVVRQPLEGGGYHLVPGGKVIASLIALPQDTIGFASSPQKNNYTGCIKFYKQDKADRFVIIDPLDLNEDGFAMLFYGFDRPGIDFGIDGFAVNPQVEDVEEGHFLVSDLQTGEIVDYTYPSPIVMKVGYVGRYLSGENKNITDKIKKINTRSSSLVNDRYYNINGQEVKKDANGVVIHQGTKILNINL